MSGAAADPAPPDDGRATLPALALCILPFLLALSGVLFAALSSTRSDSRTTIPLIPFPGTGAFEVHHDTSERSVRGKPRADSRITIVNHENRRGTTKRPV